jgi:hypothetical protein
MKLARRDLPALLVLVLALLAAAVVVRAPVWLLQRSPAATALNRGYEGVRLLRDEFDHRNFSDRGSFLREGNRPYVDVYCEYPQLATYLFALPYLFVSTNEGHMTLFAFMMAGALGGIAFVAAAVCRRLGLSPWRVLLLLLPGTLYFSLNRFDAVPAGLVLGALALLLSERIALAHVTLAAAFLTKAYPALYLPLFARVAWDGGGWRAVLRGAGAFAGTLLACTLQLAAWVGFAPILGPYLFFGNRLDNTQSVFHFISRGLPLAGQAPARALFRIAQAGLGLAALVKGRLSAHEAVRLMAAMTIAFVVFTRFQSPQWVVWITPLALLAARDATELALVAAQDVVSYIYFPVVFDRFGPTAPDLAFIVGVLTATRLILLGCLLRPIRQAADL